MKNKHLVLLFVAVLAVGLVARREQWRARQVFQTNLIQADTAVVTRISILQPGEPELQIERTEEGWAALQDNRAIAIRPEHIGPVLAALADVRSLRMVQTNRLDSLGFAENSRLRVAVFEGKKQVGQFEIGFETAENSQPATFVRVSGYEGIYLTESHLRSVFEKKLNDFRENAVARFECSSVYKIMLEGRGQIPALFEKNDSTGRWEMPGGQSVSNDSMQTWLQLFSDLNQSPFADYFDESRAPETFFCKTTLWSLPSDSLVFNVFYVKPPDLPEEIEIAKAAKLHLYVLHSSQNPRNFFAPADTVLLRRICAGPVFDALKTQAVLEKPAHEN